jgi:hypothetical protein
MILLPRTALTTAVLSGLALALAPEATAQRQMEDLGRGVVA